MVKILEPLPRQLSAGERFANAMQAGVSAGSDFAGQIGQNRAESREKQQKEMLARMKGIDIGSLKKYDPSIEDKSLNEQLAYVNKAKQLMIQNPLLSDDEAFVEAITGKRPPSNSQYDQQTQQLQGDSQEQSEEGLLQRFVKHMQERSPEIAKQRQEATPKSFGEALEKFNAKKQNTINQRQAMYEEPFSEKLKDIQQNLAGLAEQASFGFWNPAKLPEDASERLKISRDLGKVAGAALPYAAVFKGLGMGTKFLVRMSGNTGLKASIMDKALKTFGSGFIGSTFADLGAYGREGRPATDEERRSHALGLMAFEGALSVAGLVSEVGYALNLASTSTGIPKKDILREMYERTKAKGANWFKGGKVETPGGIRNGQLLEGSAAQTQPKMLAQPGEATIYQGSGRQGGEPRSRPPQFPPIKIESFEATPQDIQTAQEVASEIVQEAQTNPQALAARITQSFPQATAGRIQKVAEKRPVFKEPEATEMRKQELAAFPKYQAEVEQYESERAERRNKIKQASTLAKEEDRKALANASYPKALKQYEKLASEVRAIEDEMAKLPTEARERANALLKFTEDELAHAEQDVLDLYNIRKTGEARETMRQLEERAVKKIGEISSQVEEGKEIALSKRDYNPERVKAAQKLAKKKHPLPSRMKKFDKLFQAHEIYLKQYERRLADLDKELEAVKEVKGINDVRQKTRLMKEKDVMQKLIEHAKADIKLHEHQLDLLNLRSRQKAESTFRTLKHEIGKERTRKIALPSRDQLQRLERPATNLVLEPTPENAAKLLEKAPPEMKQQYPKGERTDIREGADQVKFKAAETSTTSSQEQAGAPPPNAKGQKFDPNDVAQATSDAKTKAKDFINSLFSRNSSSRAFRDRVTEFKDSFKNSPLEAFYKTPLGQFIIAQTVVIGYEELTGEKFPGKTAIFTYFFMRPGLAPVTVISGFIQKAFQKAKVSRNKNQYRNAVRSGDLNEITEAKKDLKPKDLKELRKEMKL